MLFEYLNLIILLCTIWLTTAESDTIVQALIIMVIMSVFVILAIHSISIWIAPIDHEVNYLIEVALDFVGRVENGIIRITNDLGLNVVVVWGGAIWKDGIGVINAVYLPVSPFVYGDISWIVSVHPSAAVAHICRS